MSKRTLGALIILLASILFIVDTQYRLSQAKAEMIQAKQDIFFGQDPYSRYSRYR